MNTPSSHHGHEPPAITSPNKARHRCAAVVLAALAAVGVAHAETKPTTRAGRAATPPSPAARN
ncbi:hypothetical protein FOZ70_25475 [Burkholderia sp. COPS]|uniref:hypothetical protein n=1 Tax=Burkholderia sp. COPS TaxID=2597663 RepID=UPI001CA5B110|nr:hypothetical protein [Burkholderia sp. COPS]MBW5808082.1 hypothetical protein [Burkholderia sp. COPS]